MYEEHVTEALLSEKPLPKAPVPSLEATLQRYVDYAKVLSNDDEHIRTKRLAKEFMQGQGAVLQRKLEEIATDAPNWVNKHWISDMYLYNRDALAVNSNPAYAFPDQVFENADDQIDFAARLVRGVFNFKRLVDSRLLPTDVSTGSEKVPLCMDQYKRLFNCYRQAASPADIQRSHTDRQLGFNQHIIVLCNNQTFVVRTVLNGEELSFAEIKHQLAEVERLAASRGTCGHPLGIFTSAHRDKAAKATELLLSHPTNAISYDWVKSSAFVLCLDEKISISSDDAEEAMAIRGKHMLTGSNLESGLLNRWYEKTLQFIVSKNGSCGMCIEHSMAEGIVEIALAEHSLRYAADNAHKRQIAKATRLLQPKPLTWHVGEALQNLLDKLADDMRRLSADLDLQVLVFGDYSKEMPKTKQLSPDGFIQLILQLVHYRLHGALVSTYESASTRRFRHGRVDNIRAAHLDALEWVKVMDDSTISHRIKRAAFDKAMAKQAQVMYENITGQGIDNHLVVLREMAKEEAAKNGQPLPEIFTEPLFKETFRFPLTTSQVNTTIEDSFLCYGPVQPDGYGCAYNFQSDKIIFAISAFKSSAKTDARKFKFELRKALRDVVAFLR